MLIDIKAFLATARAGSFSAAARELNTAASVITKRVGRLEDDVGAKLFRRSTRKLSLTPEGERLRPQLQNLVAELEDTLASAKTERRTLSGKLRIKTPTTVGVQFVGETLAAFQEKNPYLHIELMLADRSMNPVEEGLDVALGALPQSYSGVREFPLAPYPRVLVGAPGYLDRRGRPVQPGDIVSHDCLAFFPLGLTWSFSGPGGPIAVDIRARYSVNDSRLLVSGAERGLGLSVVPIFLARESLEARRLESLMPEFPVETFWLKALVPKHKLHRPEIIALLDHLKRSFDPAPW